MPKFNVVVRPRDGETYTIVGETQVALKRAGASQAEIAEYFKDVLSGDYNKVLQVTMAWVDLQPTEVDDPEDDTDDDYYDLDEEDDSDRDDFEEDDGSDTAMFEEEG